MVVLAVGPALAGCKAKTPLIHEPLVDSFERADIGAGWLDTSNGQFRVRDGKLNVSNAHNHPLWLRKRLPPDVIVELDVMSRSPAGDIKIELYGDGESFDPDEGAYFPTGYIFVFGGWSNTLSIIGKLGEHEEGVKAKRAAPGVVPGQTYHWQITRKGGQLDWKIDGQPFLSWTDPSPLYGDDKAYLAFNDWESDVYYDNLSIRPAP